MAKVAKKLVICLDNTGYEVSLERRKIYVSVPDARAEKLGQVRIIDFGLKDGSNQADGYAAKDYKPVNPPLVVAGTEAEMSDPNRWQPLQIEHMISQNGKYIVPACSPVSICCRLASDGPSPKILTSLLCARWLSVRHSLRRMARE